jgi:hypothetical protein
LGVLQELASGSLPNGGGYASDEPASTAKALLSLSPALEV